MTVRQYYSRRTPIGEMLKEARDENKLSQKQVTDRLLEDYEMDAGVQVLRDLEYLGPRNEDHLKLVEALDEIYGSNIVDEIEEYGLDYRLPLGVDFTRAIEESEMNANQISEKVAEELSYSAKSFSTYIRVWKIVGLPNIRVAEEIDQVLGTNFAENFAESQRHSVRVIEQMRADRLKSRIGQSDDKEPAEGSKYNEPEIEEEPKKFDVDKLFADMEFDLEMLVRSWRVEGYEQYIEPIAADVGKLVSQKDELLEKLIEIIGQIDKIKTKLEEKINNQDDS